MTGDATLDNNKQHIEDEFEQDQVDQVIQDMSHDDSSNDTEIDQDLDANTGATQPSTAEKSVPLQSHIKMRKRAQEAEDKAKWLEQQLMNQQRMVSAPPVVEDDSRKYESATKAELDQAQLQTQAQAVQIVEEKLWMKANPEKFQQVVELLPDFLNQRPNLRHAISTASNRYEEAYTLMEALTPKQQAQIKPTITNKQPTPKPKAAPGSPNGVGKGAALNETVDVMSMNDKEYTDWVKGRKQAARSR